MTAEGEMMPGMTVPQFNHMKVEVGIRCHGLINRDVGSVSDPVAFLYQRPNKTATWALVGRTEMVKNSLSPQFETKIKMDYIFEATQELRVELYDVDNEAHIADKSKQDFLGSAETDLATCIAAEKMQHTMNVQYKEKKDAGTVTLLITEVKECHDLVLLALSCRKLAKMNTFSSDPFFTLERKRSHSNYEVVYKSQYFKKQLNPTFDLVKMPIDALCKGKLDRTFRIRIWDYESSGKHNLIGIVDTTLNKLADNREIDIFNPEAKKEKNRTKKMGTLVIDKCEIKHVSSFMEFIQSGLRFHIAVAIDFTGSNGDPRTKSSLHYMDPTGLPNEYVTAISVVTDILTKYTGNDEIIGSGFGAVIPPGKSATHMFPLDIDTGNYTIHGVPDLIAKYASILPRIYFSGPTNFAPTISNAKVMASQLQAQRPYDFLIQLIITDGEITDMEKTIKEIVEASKTPMSIIIVGVGSSSFDKMDILDADDGHLKSGYSIQEFDNVQFVPFRQYASRPQELASQVLAELPGQIVEYMNIHKIEPVVQIHE